MYSLSEWQKEAIIRALKGEAIATNAAERAELAYLLELFIKYEAFLAAKEPRN